MLDTLRAHYLDWPNEVSIETYAKCNAACTFCPYTTLDRIGAKMPDAMLDSIIEQLKAHPKPFNISPFKVNEPFLDKRLLPFCRKINAELPNAWLRLFTNGSALTLAHIDGVAALRQVDMVWVSLNDHDPAAYKALMGLDFDRTAANLDTLHSEKAAGRFTHEVFVGRVRDALVPSAHDNDFASYVMARWPLFEAKLLKRDGWLGHVEPNSKEIPSRPCVRWFELSITATGKVSLCCMDGEAAHSIGDLNEQSLFDIYNSPAWRDRRERMISRRAVFPCSTCTYG